MSFEILLALSSENDIKNAFDWYESQLPGLGAEFLEAVEKAILSIEREPLAHQIIHKQIRRCLLQRFPYAILYIIEAGRINVIACFHHKRDPLR